MEVVSLCPFRAVGLVWQPRPSAYSQLLVCKGTFDLVPGVTRLAEIQDYPNEEDNHWDDDARRSLYSASDLVPLKPRADVLLVGHAFAPYGQEVESFVTRFVVGDVAKAIEVVSERAWTAEPRVRYGSRITKASLRYERAAGDPGWNPVGVAGEGAPDAFGMSPLPSLQPPGFMLVRRDQQIPPVGYGPLSPSWPVRRDKLGRHAATFDPARFHLSPLPPDIDPSYFNAAPADQQTMEIRPDERIELENLHPDVPHLVTTLPGLKPRVFVERAGKPPEEVLLRCDTLWIDTDRQIATLTWRGQIALADRDEPGRAYVAMEPPGRTLSFIDINRLLGRPTGPSQTEEPSDEIEWIEPEDSGLHDRPSGLGAVLTPGPEADAAIAAGVSEVASPEAVKAFMSGKARATMFHGSGARATVLGLGPSPADLARSAAQKSAASPDASAPAEPVADAESAAKPAAEAAAPLDSGPAPTTARGHVLAEQIANAQPAITGLPTTPAMAGPATTTASTTTPVIAAGASTAAPPIATGAGAATPAIATSASPPEVVPVAANATSPSPVAANAASPSPVAASAASPSPVAANAASPVSPPAIGASPSPPASPGASPAQNPASPAMTSPTSPAPNASPPAPLATTAATAATAGIDRAKPQAPRPKTAAILPDPEETPLPGSAAATSPLTSAIAAKSSSSARRFPSAPPGDPDKELPTEERLLRSAPREGLHFLWFDRDADEIAARIVGGNESARSALLTPSRAPSPPRSLNATLEAAVDADGCFQPPVVTLTGDLSLTLSSLDRLRALLTVAAVIDPVDERAASLRQKGERLLQGPSPEGAAWLAGRIADDLEAALASRAGAPDSLAGARRALHAARAYMRSLVLGGRQVRGLLRDAGGATLAVYIAEEACVHLPLDERFRARVVGELYPRVDATDPAPFAIRVVGIARIVTLLR